MSFWENMLVVLFAIVGVTGMFLLCLACFMLTITYPYGFIALISIAAVMVLIKLYRMIDGEAHREYERRKQVTDET